MAFKFKKGLNHSPDWYEEHCRDENAPSSVRAMLKRDMAYIGADNQQRVIDTERIGTYRERWNAIQGGAENLRNSNGTIFRSDVLLKAIFEVIEREAMAGLKTSDQFKDYEPFKTIGKLMDESGVDEKTMRQFLRWRSRWRAAAKKQQQASIQESASKIEKGENPFFD